MLVLTKSHQFKNEYNTFREKIQKLPKHQQEKYSKLLDDLVVNTELLDQLTQHLAFDREQFTQLQDTRSSIRKIRLELTKLS